VCEYEGFLFFVEDGVGDIDSFEVDGEGAVLDEPDVALCFGLAALLLLLLLHAIK
jgi:hypothetical protein